MWQRLLWIASAALLCACPAADGAAPTADGPAGAPTGSLSVTASAPSALPSASAQASAPIAASVQPAPATPAPKTVAFVGDISLSMVVGAYLDGSLAPDRPLESGYPFGKVQDRLKAYDLLVGNLECVVTTRGHATIKRPLKAPLTAPQLLLDAGFDVVSVANNHVQDMDDAGYEDMLARLDQAGLPYVGGNLVDRSRDPGVVRDLDGVRVAVIGHHDRHAASALADVRAARAKADVVIVFPHWGIEYGRDPTRLQRQWAHKLIDTGADVVVGAHSHIAQRDEIYDGKLISYSLGNFVFSGMIRPGSQVGTVLELAVTKRGVVGHSYRKIRIDDRGAPAFEGEPTSEPVLDPPGPRKLTALGKPIDFSALR